MKLNEENIELYIFRYKEGMLNADESAELERALEANPEWKELADLYDPELKLPANAVLPYPDAESLRDGGPKANSEKQLKPIELPRHKKIVPMWTTIAAAACLLLFVTLFSKFANIQTELQQGPETAALEIVKDTTPTTDNTVTVESEVVDKVYSPVRRKTTHTVVEDQPQNQTPVLLAETIDIQPEDEAVEVEEEQKVETPVSQPEIFYSDEMIAFDDEETEEEQIIQTSTSSRGQKIKNLAKKTTRFLAKTSATHQQRKEETEEFIESKIQSNQIISNLIAAIL